MPRVLPVNGLAAVFAANPGVSGGSLFCPVQKLLLKSLTRLLILIALSHLPPLRRDKVYKAFYSYAPTYRYSYTTFKLSFSC